MKSTKQLTTLELWEILGRNGFAKANLNLFSSKVWALPTLAAMCGESGFLRELVKHRKRRQARCKTDQWNSVNFALDAYNLAHHLHKSPAKHAARLAFGWLVHESAPGNKEICLIWFISGTKGKEKVHTFNAQTGVRVALSAEATRSVTDIFA